MNTVLSSNPITFIQRMHHRAYLVVALMCMLFGMLAQPSVAQWKQANGPFGGWLISMDANSRHLYAGLYNGLFRSSDYGVSWTRAANGIRDVNGDTSNLYVTCLAATDRYIYAGTNTKGLFRTSDDGGTWNRLGSSDDQKWNQALLVVEDKLYSASWNQVFVSTDDGMTWELSSTGLSGGVVYSLVHKDGMLFAGTIEGGVFVSTDQGAHWSPRNSGLPELHIRSLAVGRDFLFVGTQFQGAFRSSDYGVTWSRMPIDSASLVNEIAVHAGYVFAATYDGDLLRSSDEGATWTSSRSGIPTKIISVLGSFFGDVFAGTRDGIYRSTDNGLTWQATNDGMLSEGITNLETMDDRIWAEWSGCGVYVSTSAGDEWTFDTSGITGTDRECGRLNRMERVDGRLYAATSVGLFVSSDNGSSWVRRTIDSVFTTAECHAFAASQDKLFVARSLGLSISTDKGLTWTEHPQLRNLGVTNIILVGDFVYAVARRDVYRSSDDGVTWKQAYAGDPDVFLDHLASCGSKLFAAAWGGALYRSVDNGDMFDPIRADSTSPAPSSVFAIVSKPPHMFVGTDLGVYHSDDCGDHWTLMQDDLKGTRVLSLAITDSLLVAGTQSVGVWTRPLSSIPTSVGGTDNADNNFAVEPNTSVLEIRPNPFTDRTDLHFVTAQSGQVTVKVYNTHGFLVAVLTSEYMMSGPQVVSWTPHGAAGDVFLVQVQSPNQLQVQKLIYIH